jgi:GH24 family phage-related lysozyme (muramidase)
MGIIQSITYGLLTLFLVSCSKAAVIQPDEPVANPVPDSSVISLPQAPTIFPQARDLIIDFEGFDHRPAWPEGASGVTIGIGYDCGYYKPDIIRHDWNAIHERERLAAISGITGKKARDRIPGLRDIFIPTDTGTNVFDSVDTPREYDNCKRAFPGFEYLKPSAQGAIISLGYNRGYGFSGDSRKEMRAIRDLVPKKDYRGIASQIRAMKRIWRGTAIQNGMNRRRDAEARMVEQ